MKRFRLTQNAQADRLYVAQESGSSATAERVLERLRRAIVTITSQPGIGLPCPDVDPKGLSFPVGQYIVYYRRETSRIAITHVFSGLRDQRNAWRNAGDK